TIYVKHSMLGMVDYLPFSFVTNQMLEIVLNNYILDVPITFYSSLFISIFILVLIVIGRYRS
ncbi:ABC transporter permease, partial [Staphylococcus cohnii]